MDDIGSETNAVSPFESTDYEDHRCQHVAVAPEDAPEDAPDLQIVIEAWHQLRDSTRRQLLTAVQKEIHRTTGPATTVDPLP